MLGQSLLFALLGVPAVLSASPRRPTVGQPSQCTSARPRVFCQCHPHLLLRLLDRILLHPKLAMLSTVTPTNLSNNKMQMTRAKVTTSNPKDNRLKALTLSTLSPKTTMNGGDQNVVANGQFLCGLGAIPCQRIFATGRSLMSHQCQRHTGIERGCRYLCSFCDAGSNSERNFRTHTIRKHAQYATPPRLLGSYVFQYRPGSCLGIVVSENRLGEPCEVAARVHNSNGVPGIFFVGEFAEETLEGMNVAYNIAKQLHTERYGPQFFEQTLIDFRVPPEDVRLTSTSTTAAAFMAMYSLAVPRCVRMDTIISACVEPDGSLAPVGLLSQKVLGAVDFGVRRMILSSQNVNHVLALPEEDKRGMEFIYVANCEEILERMF